MTFQNLFEFWEGGRFFVATATALAYAALAVTAVGTYATIYGQKQQAATAAAVANYNSKVQVNQAIQSDMDSRESIRREREKNLLFIGAQRAQTAASGVAQEGSPLEVLAHNAGTLELQAMDDARAASNRFSAGINAAGMTKQAGDATASAYKTAQFGTLLSGAAKIAGQVGTGLDNGSLGGGSKAWDGDI